MQTPVDNQPESISERPQLPLTDKHIEPVIEIQKHYIDIGASMSRILELGLALSKDTTNPYSNLSIAIARSQIEKVPMSESWEKMRKVLREIIELHNTQKGNTHKESPVPSNSQPESSTGKPLKPESSTSNKPEQSFSETSTNSSTEDKGEDKCEKCRFGYGFAQLVGTLYPEVTTFEFDIKLRTPVKDKDEQKVLCINGTGMRKRDNEEDKNKEGNIGDKDLSKDKGKEDKMNLVNEDDEKDEDDENVESINCK